MKHLRNGMAAAVVGLVVIFSACNKVPDDRIIVEYTIHNPYYKTIDFYYHEMVEFGHKVVPTLLDTVIIDTFFTDQAIYLSFSTKEMVNFYAEPGAYIKFELDTGKLLSDRVKVSGDLSDMNEYMLQLSDFNNEINAIGGLGMGKKPMEFLELVDSVTRAKKSLLDFSDKKNSEHSFWMQQKEDIKLAGLSHMESYRMYYYASFKEPLSEEWQDKIKPDYSQLLDKPELLILPFMRYSLDSYIFHKSLSLSNEWWMKNKDSINSGSLKRRNIYEFGSQFIIDSIGNEEVKNFLLVDLAKRAFNRGELKPIENVLKLFYNNCTNTEFLNFIRSEEEGWKKLQPEAMAPEIIGYTPEGEARKLSDFKGQFVFIDIWATSCGPCIGEFPSFRKLVEAYKDRDITFIMYSLDDDKEAWLDYLENNEMSGVQLISESGSTCNLTKDYKFRGIPRHMFFDPEGKIIGTGLERPSFLHSTKFLDKYLDDPKYTDSDEN